MHECLILLYILFQTDSNIEVLLSTYSALCGSGGAACAAATAAFLTDTTCDTDTVEVLCTGTCRALVDNFLSACPADVSF